MYSSKYFSKTFYAQEVFSDLLGFEDLSRIYSFIPGVSYVLGQLVIKTLLKMMYGWNIECGICLLSQKIDIHPLFGRRKMRFMNFLRIFFSFFFFLSLQNYVSHFRKTNCFSDTNSPSSVFLKYPVMLMLVIVK